MKRREFLSLLGSRLDRTRASEGYTAANTRLVPHERHIDEQRVKGYV